MDIYIKPFMSCRWRSSFSPHTWSHLWSKMQQLFNSLVLLINPGKFEEEEGLHIKWRLHEKFGKISFSFFQKRLDHYRPFLACWKSLTAGSSGFSCILPLERKKTKALQVYCGCCPKGVGNSCLAPQTQFLQLRGVPL